MSSQPFPDAPAADTSAATSAASESLLDADTFAVSDEIEAAYATAPHLPPSSGDFHAAFPLENGGVGFVLGDVAGHGPEAAVHAKALCRAVVGCLLEGLPPDEALGFVNAAAEMSPHFDGFATVVAGTVAPGTGEIVYASGGHEPSLLTVESPKNTSLSQREKQIIELDSTGPPLGVVGGDEVRYGRGNATLPPSGTLLMYTDGISDARRGQHFLGMNRLRGVFARFAAAPPLTLVCKIIGYARAFTGQGHKLRDDAALLALRRRAPFKKKS